MGAGERGAGVPGAGRVPPDGLVARGAPSPDGLVVRGAPPPDGLVVRGAPSPDGLVVRGAPSPDELAAALTVLQARIRAQLGRTVGPGHPGFAGAWRATRRAALRPARRRTPRS